VLDKNPGKEAQAQAAYSLAKLLQSRANWARTLKKADSQGLANLEKALSKMAIRRMVDHADADRILDRPHEDSPPSRWLALPRVEGLAAWLDA
jgi:hypothetical protein